LSPIPLHRPRIAIVVKRRSFYDPPASPVKDDCCMARRRTTAFSPPALEPQLSRARRRATGVYYTPPEIVQLIVELTLAPLLDATRHVAAPLRILDPACGAGEFLVEAYRLIAATRGTAASRRAIFGVDIDPAAVAVARQRLIEIDSRAAAWNIIVGDALEGSRPPLASFDAVIGNPPYVNIRLLAKSLSRERIDALCERYLTARGNFDLYVVFIERALQLLRPGGRCGLIIPNKWATLDYARACRELLLERATIEQVVDLSDERAFAKASVYPQIIVLRKEQPRGRHLIQFREGMQNEERRAIAQRSLSPAGISFTPTIDVESRVPTQALGELAKLSCGTAGFSAQRIARRLLDIRDTWQSKAKHLADFITSGNIDRYAIRLGNVRYMNHTYTQPRLPLDSPELTPSKRRLFVSPKIVIAGMSRRLEAAWDDRGLALGVQVFAASDCQVDPFFLLALLNSKLLSYLFATRFAAKRLAGGYLAINKGQLCQLPIVAGTLRVPSLEVRLAALARSLSKQPGNLAQEYEADRLVYELYHLSDEEIARVERHFAQLLARAA